MDLEYSPEQHLLRRSVRDLLSAFDNSPRDGKRDAQIWEALAKGGFLRVGLPVRVGGSGDPVDMMIVSEELGWALAAGAYVETLVVAGRLLAAAPDARFKHLINAIMDGSALVAVAWDEPGERCDVDTRLIATAMATGWRVDGRKPLVAGAAAAGHWVVEATSRMEMASALCSWLARTAK